MGDLDTASEYVPTKEALEADEDAFLQDPDGGIDVFQERKRVRGPGRLQFSFCRPWDWL